MFYLTILFHFTPSLIHVITVMHTSNTSVFPPLHSHRQYKSFNYFLVSVCFLKDTIQTVDTISVVPIVSENR
jgi:MFS-type transporter involved in bile tolerance (Atg22 family)